jgi:TolB-like protein
VAAALLLLIGAAAAWWFLRPANETGPKTLAVLPFRALNASDANLVDAIWDDTRGAISRNPNLRVLGRQSVEALAAQHLQPADYRKKVGADYLLDGSVQHVGDEVQLKLSLVQTKDGSEVWSDKVGGKLDDVFAFQQRVANEVEGRIRGRVAPGGGTTPKNITTSGEVYALYAEARANLKERGPGVKRAIPLLKQAVAKDPNFAPAWADLGEAVELRHDGTLRQIQDEAGRYVQRALTLAPNLAHAYAVRALIDQLEPDSETDLRKAVSLDPNDVEAWMWLGNCMGFQNRGKDALAAHTKAVEIEPIWDRSMLNRMDDFARLADREGILAELRRAESVGDKFLALRARQHSAWLNGQIAEELKYELEIRRLFPDRARPIDLVDPLLQLGYADAVPALLNLPHSIADPYKGIPLSPQGLRNAYKDPRDFWRDQDTPNVYGRLLPTAGRLAEYVSYYKSAFRNADEFYDTVAWGKWTQMAEIAPTAAANLKAAGETVLAQQLIDKEEAVIAPWLRNGPANWLLGWYVAQLRAVEGRDDEAIEHLKRVIGQGWIPNGSINAVDIGDEPAFAGLAKRADFQALRQGILKRIAEQRRQITPQMLESAGIRVSPVTQAA